MMKLKLSEKLLSSLPVLIEKEDWVSVSRRIKSSYKRLNKRDLVKDFFTSEHLKLPICNFCKKEFIPLGFFSEIILEDNYLYLSSFTRNDNLSFCRQKECPGKKLNPNSKEFVSKSRGISEEEAINLIHSRNKSPFYKENHISEEEYRRSQSRNEEYFIQRYGEEEGKRRAKKMFDQISLKNSTVYISQTKGYDKAEEVNAKKAITLDNMIRVHGEVEGKIIYQNWKNKIGRSLENYILSYGEDKGKELYHKYRKSKLGIGSLHWYKEKYGHNLGKVLYEEKNKSCAITLHNLISKYGEEEGGKRYKEFIVKTTKKLPATSKESLKFFFPLIKMLWGIGIKTKDLYIGTSNKKEYFLWDSDESRIKFYDFCIPHLKIIIEYHGEAYHPNAKKMTESERNIWKSPFGVGFEEAHNNDIRKKKLAEEYGFQYFEVFSSENLKERAEFLYNIIKEIKNDFE